MAEILGTEGSDILDGTSENDVVRGFGGNDTLDGKEGADDMRAGAGDDIYYVDSSGDWTIEQMNEGFDTIFSTVSYTMGAFTEEMFLIGPNALTGNGNQLDNRIHGNEYNNRFFDAGGSDAFYGGAGDDYYDVRFRIDGNVTVGFTFTERDSVFEFAGEGIDTIRSNGSYTLPDHVENLILMGTTFYSLRGIGNALDNVLTGGSLDTLEGGAGNDEFHGGRSIRGGTGDDVYYLGNSSQTVTEYDGEGFDIIYASGTVSNSPFIERLEMVGTADIDAYGSNLGDLIIGNPGANRIFGHEGNDTIDGGAGNDKLEGGLGDDHLDGGAGDDLIYQDEGGNDVSNGGDGNDGFYFGNALTADDVVDGGAGSDSLAIRGLTTPDFRFGANNLTNVEVLMVASGFNQTFPERSWPVPAPQPLSYDLITDDMNVAAGRILTVIAGSPGGGVSGLQASETLQFDGSAETDGAFRIFAGLGADLLIGGAGSDGFFFETGGLTAADRVDGGAGIDSVALRGDYAGEGADGGASLVLAGATLANVEVLAILSGHSNEFGGAIVAGGFDYDLTLGDANVAAGARLDVSATGLANDEIFRFDGRAEQDGSYRILAGAGDDLLFGGAGNDILYGGLGADTQDGGAGADTYLYRAVLESTATARDEILLGDGDRIDLSMIDAIAGTPANDAFTFIGSASFSGTAGELHAIQVGAQWLVEADTNGDGTGDLVLAATSIDPIVAADFVF